MSDVETASDGLPTMVDVLYAHAERDPAKAAYVFLPENPTAGEERLDYGELVRRAQAVAGGLEAWFAERPALPRMAVLLFPAGLDFLVAFWACLCARVIAIPCPVPRPNRPMTALQALIANAGVRLALSRQDLFATLDPLLGDGSGRWALTLEEMADAGVARPCGARPTAEDIAFLQYTSGSTSRPKGVVVRHRNLMANERMIAGVMALEPGTSVMVNWMPHYHDMGLIGSLLQPIHRGTTCYSMAPVTFLKRPLRWLQAISTARATVSGGPDFAFRLCAERIRPEEAAELDLSSWKVAFVGAEPVRAATLEAFATRFAVAGFRKEALYPCYGMAEVTLLAAGSHAGGGAVTRLVSGAGLACGRAVAPVGEERRLEAVCSGWAPAGAQLAIVDPARCVRLPDGSVGEIWVAGPHVADGYFNDARISADTFGSRIAGELDADAGSWLRTGDVGFMMAGGLYVTGRSKEVMIVNGRNLYPHDVEDVLRGGMAEIRDAAVFALPRADGPERIVAVLELAARQRGLLSGRVGDSDSVLLGLSQLARRVCVQGAELMLDHVRFVLPGGIPKTTSGKTRYGELRSAMAAMADDAIMAGLSVAAPAEVS